MMKAPLLKNASVRCPVCDEARELSDYRLLTEQCVFVCPKDGTEFEVTVREKAPAGMTPEQPKESEPEEEEAEPEEPAALSPEEAAAKREEAEEKKKREPEESVSARLCRLVEHGISAEAAVRLVENMEIHISICPGRAPEVTVDQEETGPPPDEPPMIGGSEAEDDPELDNLYPDPEEMGMPEDELPPDEEEEGDEDDLEDEDLEDEEFEESLLARWRAAQQRNGA